MAVESSGLDHFLRLARSGRFPAASGGEQRAAKLAALVVDEVPGLDDRAIAGLIEFIRGTKNAPQAARELIED
jgi:hypothetical protein